MVYGKQHVVNGLSHDIQSGQGKPWSCPWGLAVVSSLWFQYITHDSQRPDVHEVTSLKWERQLSIKKKLQELSEMIQNNFDSVPNLTI